MLKLLQLLLITQDAANFHQVGKENSLADLFLDPEFQVNSIAIWSIDNKLEWDCDFLRAIIARNFPVTIFTYENTDIMTVVDYEMLILHLDVESLVCIKFY